MEKRRKVRAKRKAKPGYKTTEFWMTILVVIGSIAGSLTFQDPKFAIAASTLAVSCYTIARNLKKLETEEEITLIHEANNGTKTKTRKT